MCVNQTGEQLIYQKLGEGVKMKRKAIQMKQEELARLVQLSRASIVNIEKGRHRPQLHILYSLAASLGCQPADLLPSTEFLTQQLPDSIARKLKKDEKPAVAHLISMALKGDKK
jgi:DNA-binding XRE family transcriptional regulator